MVTEMKSMFLDLLQCKIGAPVIKKDDLKLIITLLKYMNVQVKKENDE